MNTVRTVAVSVLLMAVSIGPVHAQQPGTSTDPHHPKPAGSSATMPTPDKGPGMPMMDMCMRMMSGMGMEQPGGGPGADPKDKAAMLEMRAEMMKAMGEVMLKHAERMRGMPGR